MELRLRALAPVAVLAFVAGCAASAPRAGAPGAMEEPTPTTIDEATAQIDRARTALGVPNATKGPAGMPAQPTATPPSAPPTPAPQPAPEAASESAPEAARESEASNGCAEACRAIGSMRRAVGVLCRLAGDEDERCVDAKKTLDDSEKRVARCGC